MKNIIKAVFVLLSVFLMSIASMFAASETEIEEAIKMMRANGMDEAQIQQIVKSMKMLKSMEVSSEKRKIKKPEKGETQAQSESKKQQTVIVSPVSGKLSGALGNTEFSMNLTRCKSEPYRSGNLVTLAEVTAQGVFNGATAVIFFYKSHVVGNKDHSFEQAFIYLTELTQDELALSHNEFTNKRGDEYQQWYAPRSQAIQDKYKDQFHNDLSVDELNALMEAQQREFDALEEEGHAKELKYAMMYGPVTVDEGVISFTAPQVQYNGSGRTPDPFFDIENQEFSLVASCN